MKLEVDKTNQGKSTSTKWREKWMTKQAMEGMERWFSHVWRLIRDQGKLRKGQKYTNQTWESKTMEIKSPIQNEITFQIGTSKERIHKKLNLKFSSISNSLNYLFKFSLPIQKSFLIHKTNFEFKPEISYSTLDLEFNLLDFLQIKFPP